MNHPFMITSNQSYGLQIEKLKAVNNSLDTSINTHTEHEMEHKHDLSFLYTKESDCIGQGVPPSEHPLAKQFRKKIHKPRKVTTSMNDQNSISNKIQSQDHVKALLSQYNHAPKLQSPLYTTTANTYGMKKPSAATYTAERHARSQQFSKSYNRMMFRDHGLNY